MTDLDLNAIEATAERAICTTTGGTGESMTILALVAELRTIRERLARTDADGLADQVLPLDAADPEQVTAAANLLSELVGRLCHATRHAGSVPTPQDADRTVAALATTVERLPQLCRQLVDRMTTIAGLDGLAADNLGPVPTGGAPAIACRAGGRLSWAADQLGQAAATLDAAQRDTSRLYIADGPLPPAEEPPLPPRPILEGP